MTIVALLNKTRLAFIAFFLLLLLVLPLVDPDYFWHLKTGEYIVSHRALPAGDIFSSTRFGQAWVLHEWLFEVVLYAMFEWLGAPGVKLLTVTLAMSALGIVFALARRLGQSPALAFILTVVALIPFSSGISARPQLVTYLLFAAYLYILLSYKYHQARLSLVALPLLMLIWVNAHGGYVIGIALTGLFTACEWIVYWMGQGRDPAHKLRLVRLTQVACATVLASLANPDLLEHWLYPFQVLGMQANERIQEWTSANFHEFGPRAYLMLVLLFLLSCTYAVRKPDFTEIVVPLFFLVNGFIALRHIPLAVLVLIPFTALAFSRGALAALSALWRSSTLAKRYQQDTAASKQLGQGEYVLNWLVLGMIVISLAAVTMMSMVNGYGSTTAAAYGAAEVVVEVSGYDAHGNRTSITDANGNSYLFTYTPTGAGRRLGEMHFPPVVVDDVLVQGDCNGVLHGYDVSDPRVLPPELWSVELGGCIESTPAVWRGRLFVGTRAGRFFAIGDRE